MQHGPQSIKISQTGKGLYHWEDQLLRNQRVRLNKLLTQYNVNPWKKRDIMHFHETQCNRENIIALHSHPIQEYLAYLLDNNISELLNYSSTKA